jgi:hypothetical protein
MAEDFTTMMADRVRAAQRTRLTQFYIDQGYEPARAAAMAVSELGRREQAASSTANDAVARTREMNDRDLGPENQQRIQQMYRSNPALLGMDQPSPQLDQYSEAPLANRDRAQFDPVMRSVETESGQPIVRFSSRPTEEDVLRARPPQPNIYEGALRTAREALSPAPRAQAQAPTYSTPSFPSSDASGDERLAMTSLGQMIDRARQAVAQGSSTGATAAPAAAPMAASAVNGEYNDVFNVPYSPVLSGQYNDVDNVPYTAPRTAPARRAAPAQAPAAPAKSESQPSGGGLFSGLFKDPYAGMSSAKLMEASAAKPDDAASFFRADAALRRERPEMFKGNEEGMARGGAAEGGKGGGHHKDAVVMKALEIIHHMLRGR